MASLEKQAIENRRSGLNNSLNSSGGRCGSIKRYCNGPPDGTLPRSMPNSRNNSLNISNGSTNAKSAEVSDNGGGIVTHL